MTNPGTLSQNLLLCYKAPLFTQSRGSNDRTLLFLGRYIEFIQMKPTRLMYSSVIQLLRETMDFGLNFPDTYLMCRVYFIMDIKKLN